MGAGRVKLQASKLQHPEKHQTSKIGVPRSVARRWLWQVQPQRYSM